MAKPAKQPEAEPEIRAYAVVRTPDGLYVRREYLIVGDKVLAYQDSDRDLRRAQVGLVFRSLNRDE